MTINSHFTDFSCICESQPFSVFLAFSPSIKTSVLFWCGFSASMHNCSEFYWQWCTLYCNLNLFINNWTMLLSGALSVDRDVSDQIRSPGSMKEVWTLLMLLFSRYTLQASTFQMAILLQYNTEDSYTVQQLTDSTQIKTVSAHTHAFKINDFVQPHTSCPSLTLWCFIFRTFWFKSCRFCWNQSCWWVKQTKPQTFISVSLSGVFVFARAGEILHTNSWFWI